jgi:cytochrome c
MSRRLTTALAGLTVIGLLATPFAGGAVHAASGPIAPGLVLPRMDAANGKRLFAERGCVACHQVNGIGGTLGAALDADADQKVISPFDFFARMWRGAAPMIALQEEATGAQLDFSGQDLADIIAFVHDREAQKDFSADDIPDRIKALMEAIDQSGTSGETP